MASSPELLIQLAAFIGEGSRLDVLQGVKQVAASARRSRESLALEPELAVRATARRNLHAHRVRQGRRQDLGTKSGFPRPHRQRDVKIRAFATEHPVRLDVDAQVQVAALASVAAGGTLASNTHARAVLDPCRNFHLNRAMFSLATSAVARGAWAPTLIAGSATGLAGDLFSQPDAAGDPCQYLGEGQLDSGFEILARCGESPEGRTASGARSSPEDRGKNIAKVLLPAEGKFRPHARARASSSLLPGSLIGLSLLP